jgi:hypothetical protein
VGWNRRRIRERKGRTNPVDYLLYFLGLLLTFQGIIHFHVVSVADFFAVAGIWCSGYLMSYVFKP